MVKKNLSTVFRDLLKISKIPIFLGFSCYSYSAPGDNLALGGVASQSSTLLQNNGITNLQFPSANKAIDGSTNGDFDADISPFDGLGTVSHTLDVDGGNHWWEVDLNFSQNVGEITVYNRTDANSANLAGAVVIVLDNEVDRNVVFTSNPLTGDSAPQLVEANVRGQIVRIEKPGTSALALAEVEVIEGTSQIASTSVGGRVMREFNFDGQANLALFEEEEWEGVDHRRKIRHGEFPLPGATVNVFDEANNLVGTAVSDASGFWEVDAGSASGAALRVEFLPPAGYEQTPLGGDNASSIVFTNQGEAQVNFAAGDGADYAEDNPNFIFVCFARTVDPVTDRTIISLTNSEGIPYRSRDGDFSSASDAGTPVGTLPQAVLQDLATIGDESATTFGMAWDRKNQRVFTGSFERAFTAMGSDAAGNPREAAIYAIGRNGGVSLWLDLEELLGEGIAGIDGPEDTSVPGPRTFERTPDEGQNLPGHIGLGSLAISRDGTELYAVNLFSQEVYVIPIPDDGAAPTSAAQVRAFPLPVLPASTNPLPVPLPDGYVDGANGAGWDDDADGFPDRPAQAALGLGVHPSTGEVYATLTRTGPSLDDLEGFVYSFDPSDTTPSSSDFNLELQIPLNHDAIAVLPTGNTWDTQVRHAWVTLQGGITNPDFPSGFALQRQHIMPWLGEVEFDLGSDGEVRMIVSTRNRYHDQLNSGNFVAGGTCYRVCNAGSELSPTWQLENNGECDGLVSEFDRTISTIGPVSVATDPVNRFFFTSGREGNFAAGTSDILPGFAEIAIPAMDNIFNNGTSGISWLSTSGARSRDARVIGTYQPNGFDQIAFTKSNNWGSIVAAPLRAPIEVGNLVWIDTDGDGIQDPSESGFSGVEVQLRDPSGTVIATAVTDENGNYSFINDERFATGGTGSASTVFVAGLTSETSGYQVCIDTTQTRISSTGVAPTTANVVSGTTAAIQAGSDLRDSDGVQNGNEICSALFDTGNDGESNHSFDFGFQGVAIGDFVWADTNGNGQQDVDESGIEGVEVKLLDSLGGLVSVTTTNSSGFYQFTTSDGVAPNTSYRLCINDGQAALEGFGLVDENQGSDGALDSDAVLVSGAAIIDFTSPSLGGSDFTLDFGFGQVTIGDFVWADANGDSLQDPTEEGIEGVVVKLLNTDGSPVLQTISEDYQDDFESGISGSIGTTDWSDTSWALGANVSFVAGDIGLGNSTTVLRFVDNDANAETSMATRLVNLSGCVSDPTISFVVREVAASGETLSLEYSEDGATFIQLANLNNTGNAYNAQSFTLPRSAIAIRFSANPNLDGPDFWEIDDFQIACSDVIEVTSVTNASGFYSFSSSANGIEANTSYLICIEEAQPALLGFVLVSQNQGDDSLDSDAENTSTPGFAVISATTPSAGNEDLSFDFGFGRVRIGNFVWFDEDGDGQQGSAENGISGVVVKLLNSDGSPFVQTFFADYQDDFESGINGSTGVTDWSGTPWDLGANVVFISDGTDLALQLGDSDNNSVTSTATRLVDLSNCFSDPVLSFQARELAADNNEELFIEYSVDGITFMNLGALNNIGGTFIAQNFTLPRAAVAIRFVADTALGGGEFWQIDDLQIICSDTIEVTTTTDGSGFYEFTSADGLLPLTDYQVCIDNNQAPIIDLALTTQNAGGVATNDPLADDEDSDASGTILTGFSIIPLTTPAVGNENLGYDFGFTEVTIGNFVWFDADGDGLFDAGEQGIDGVTVVLLDSSRQPVLNRAGQPAVQVTSGGGFYQFTPADGVVPNGSYIIAIDLSQGSLSTFSLTGQDTGGVNNNDPINDDEDSDAAENNGFAEIELTAPTGGNENQSFDFGFGRVQIGNFVWNDINGDGLQSPAELGIEGVVVKLLDAVGNLVTVDTGVEYRDDLESGGFTGTTGMTDWSATPWVPVGVAIFDDSGATGGDGNAIQLQSQESISRAVDLTSCNSDPTVTFRYREFVSANTEQLFFEYTEDGVNYITVATFANTGSGQPYFSFAGTIPQEAIEIRFRTSSFGASELFAVDDVFISCFESVPAVVTTDENGFYSFDSTDGLVAETEFQLCIELAQPVLSDFSLAPQDEGGITSNDPVLDDEDSDAFVNGSNQAIITFTSPLTGQTNNGYDFGFGRFAIGDFVWRDVNGDGIQDPDEPGIEGVSVKLLDSAGDPVMQSLGDDYADDFESGGTAGSTGETDWSLTPWVSSVSPFPLIDDSGIATGTANALRVGDGQTFTRAIDLSQCLSDPTVTFRYREAVNVNGETMFFEYTEDGSTYIIVETFNNTGSSQPYFTFNGTIPQTSVGIRFRGNTNLESGDFYAVDDLEISCLETGPVIQVTDAEGFYEFTSSEGLEGETNYEICIDLSQNALTGLLVTTPNASGVTSSDPLDDGNDSDASENGSGDAVISLTSPSIGGENPGYDFGFVETKIGNFVWRDLNSDGLQSSDEPGIEGAIVRLLNSDGSPALAENTVNYVDDFESNTNSGSVGTTDWSATPWVATGGASIVMDEGDLSYQLTNGSPDGVIERLIDLTACSPGSSAELLFNVRSSIGGGLGGFQDRADVQYSEDGTNYVTLITLTQNNTNGTYQSSTTVNGGNVLTIPSTATSIRFVGLSLENNEFIWIDDVVVNCTGMIPIETVTSSEGEYCFTTGDGLLPDTNYLVEVEESQPALINLVLTETNAGSVTTNDPIGDDDDSDAENTSNPGFARIAIVSPSNGDVNQSYDFGFSPTKPNTYFGFLLDNADALGLSDNLTNGVSTPGIPEVDPLTGVTNTGVTSVDSVDMAGLTDNPDGDFLNNLLEFALCYDPGSGAKNFPTGERNEGLQLVHNPDGTVDAVFSVPTDANELSYQLESSTDGRVWTTVAISPVTISNPAVSGVSTMTVAGVQVIEPEGTLYRLQVTAITANPVVTAFSPVVGFQTTRVLDFCQSYSDPTLLPCPFSGTVSSVTDQTLSFVDSVSTQTLTDVLEVGRSYYLEVTAGAGVGNIFDVVNFTDTTVVLAEQTEVGICSLSPPFNTLLTVPDLTNSQIIIREYRTVGELFPAAELDVAGAQIPGTGFTRGATAAEAATLLRWNRSTAALEVYYLSLSGDWLNASGGGLVNDFILPPGEGIFVHDQEGATSFDLVQCGEVRLNQLSVPLKEGLNFVASAFPVVAQSPDGTLMGGGVASHSRQLNTSTTDGNTSGVKPAFAGNSAVSRADQILLWSDDDLTMSSDVPAEHYKFLFLLSGAGGLIERWAEAGTSNPVSMDNALIFEANRSAFMQMQIDAPGYYVVSPFLNN